MRKLATIICLTLAMLLGGEVRGSDLPPCRGENYQSWSDCFGTHTDGNRSRYVGEYRDGTMHGQGKLTLGPSSKFPGEYVGGFRNNKMHGQGTYFYPSGSIYVGELRDGTMHGQGTFTYGSSTKFSGAKYVGGFRNNKKNGQGTYYHGDGRVTEGIWKDEKFLYAQKVSPNDPSDTDKMSIRKAKTECKELAFKPQTEKFGECVLQLTK